MVIVRQEVRDHTENWMERARKHLNSELVKFGLEVQGNPWVVATGGGITYLDWPVENR